MNCKLIDTVLMLNHYICQSNYDKKQNTLFKRTGRLFKYMKPYKIEFSFGIFFLLLSTAASLIFPALMGNLVDSASEKLVNNINQIAIALLVLFALQAIFSYFRIVLFVNVTEKTLAVIRQETYAQLIKLPMNFFSKRRVGELNSRIASDISLLQETFTTDLAEFLRQVLIIIGGIVFLSFDLCQTYLVYVGCYSRYDVSCGLFW